VHGDTPRDAQPVCRTRDDSLLKGREFKMTLDLAMEDDLNIPFPQAVFNTNEDRRAKLMNDTRPMIGMSDANAHVN
jgi:hypothetical protein